MFGKKSGILEFEVFEFSPSRPHHSTLCMCEEEKGVEWGQVSSINM